MKSKLFTSSVLVLILSLLTSCLSNLQGAIIGNWKDINEENSYIQFFKDGTVSATGRGMSLGGSYKFLEPQTIKVELGGMGALAGPVIYKVSIEGNQLSLTNPNGQTEFFERGR
jgi:hypothetical protein